MAISFINQITSNKFLPVANPVNITVNSNNNGKCNFRYVCDIYLDNQFVYRFKLFPDPSTGYGFFQLSDVLTDYLADYNTVNNTAGFAQATVTNTKSVALIQCRFGEEYDNSVDCDGEIQLYLNLANSNQFYVFNAVLPYEDWPSYLGTEYLVDYTASGTKKFLTNIVRGSADATYADSVYLDYLTLQTTTSPILLHIDVTRKNGSTYSATFSVTGSINQRRMRISCGPDSINRSKQLAFINDSTQYYDAYIKRGATQSTEKFRINVVAPKTYRTRIGFVNNLGSIDHITFYHRNRQAYNIERKEYKRYLTSNKGGGSWSYAVGDRQRTQYASNAQEQHLVTTFVSQDTSRWLNELYLSNNVWVETRPRLLPFRVYREDSTPTSRMLFWLDDDHGLKVGDSFICIPEDKPENADYLDFVFTIIDVDGNKVDAGVSYNQFNLTEELCGWLVVQETAVRVPIVITDSGVEVRQRLGRPIEYQLAYVMSVDKFTLRS